MSAIHLHMHACMRDLCENGHSMSPCLTVSMHQGFISSEEFSSIPELSINPLHSRMGQMFNHVNFKV